MEDFELEKLDDIEDEWINQIYEKEKELDKYYKNNIYFICINYVYVDIYKNILKIKKENIKITDNFLSKENILDIIKKNNKICRKEFKIFSICKYNFHIDIENISKYNSDESNGEYNSDEYNEEFFQNIKSIKDIYWQKTIPIFERLNCLYLFFTEKSDNKTKKNRKNGKNGKNGKTRKLKITELYLKNEIIKLN